MLKFNPLYRYSYKATVDAQVDLYKKLKLHAPPNFKEADILNEVVNSRTRAESMLSEFQPENQRAFYNENLKHKNKTLMDVILAIVYFEFVESRKDSLKGIRPEDRLRFMAKVANYTEKQIAKILK